jgi:hypothetical protein
LFLLGSAPFCGAADITYDVSQTIGAGNVTGFIETDGTIGALGGVNIINWSLLINNTITTFDLNSSNSFFIDRSPDLSATATQLLYDFSGSGLSFFYFVENSTTESTVLCYESAPGTCATASDGSGEVLYIGNAGLQFASLSGTQVIAALSATTPGVPEPSTLALLGAGVAVLAFRKSRK